MTTSRVKVRVTPELAQQLDEAAQAEGVSTSEIVRRCVVARLPFHQARGGIVPSAKQESGT